MPIDRGRLMGDPRPRGAKGRARGPSPTASGAVCLFRRGGAPPPPVIVVSLGSSLGRVEGWSGRLGGRPICVCPFRLAVPH